jgi:hypothetical protein
MLKSHKASLYFLLFLTVVGSVLVSGPAKALDYNVRATGYVHSANLRPVSGMNFCVAFLRSGVFIDYGCATSDATGKYVVTMWAVDDFPTSAFIYSPSTGAYSGTEAGCWYVPSTGFYEAAMPIITLDRGDVFPSLNATIDTFTPDNETSWGNIKAMYR